MKKQNEANVHKPKIQLILPLEGLSEYLVQKTQAGQSCPFGPRTIPGGTSSLPESLELLESPSEEEEVDDALDERSTGWEKYFQTFFDVTK